MKYHLCCNRINTALSEIFFAVICPVADTAKEEEGRGAFAGCAEEIFENP
jgi:hypothetical protein